MNNLIAQLKSYPALDAVEKNHVERTIKLIETVDQCFYRTCCNPGHLTGSVLLISADAREVLMNHHKSLKKWLCFGGHADGETDLLKVARRELIEESGLEAIEPVSEAILDVDIHPIPANSSKNEPFHEHFDVCYLFRCLDDAKFTVSDESIEMKWCSFEEAVSLTPSRGMRRILGKWREKVKS